MANHDRWKRRVAKVFDTRPRLEGHAVWLDRKDTTKRFESAFDRIGAHICLDGPTGAGKTSLALSYLVRNEVRHVAVQVTSEMDWPSFCRHVISPPTAEELSLGADIEFGMDKGLPVAKLRISLGEKGSALNDANLLDKLAHSWTEHDVARRLSQRNAALFVDDLERANPKLLRRIADTCKLLTQTYIADNAKVIMVGSGDVYQSVYHENPSLEERLTQVSLGGFKYRSDSAHFIRLGFNALRLWNPWNSSFPDQRRMIEKCEKSIWEAANGLPKSLNRIGYEISVRGENRKGVTASDIIDEAEKMIQDHWMQYAQRFPAVVEYLYENESAVQTVAYIYKHGISQIHKIYDVVEKVQKRFTGHLGEIDAAIDGLVAADFLVRTGKSGELLFVKHPTAAHTLGVAMRDPARFRHIVELERGRPSLGAAFSIDEDGLGLSAVDHDSAKAPL